MPTLLCNGEPPTDLIKNLYHRLMAKTPDERPDSTLAVADRLMDCVRITRGEMVDGIGQGFEFGNVTLGNKGKRVVKKVSEPGLRLSFVRLLGIARRWTLRR